MSESRTPTRPRRIAVVAFPGCLSLDVLGPLEVFATADALRAHKTPGTPPLFELEILSPTAGPLRTSSGLSLIADRSLVEAEADHAPAIDTLLIAGGDMRKALHETEWIDWIRRQKGRTRRLGAVCTGSFLLARAGLLDGRRATTHWAAAERLSQRFPGVEVDADSIYISDGVYTSAGATAGIDLALALLEEDLDREWALEVARFLVVFLKRPGGQSQFSSLLAAQSAEPGPWGELLRWMAEHPAEALTVEALAKRAHLSPRHFSRAFSKQMGMTPAKWVERLRVDTARRILQEQPELSLEEVARACGLSEAGVLRRLFLRHLEITPREYRRRFVTPKPRDQK